MNATEQTVQAIDEVDRVRSNSAANVNAMIDRELFHRLVAHAALPVEQIDRRIAELEKEWDIERTIQLQASVTALLGIWLAFRVNWKWIWLSIINQAFLLEHSLQGWCPPVALQRTWKRRTRREIQLEILALRILRGEFGEVPAGDPVDRAQLALLAAVGRRR